MQWIFEHIYELLAGVTVTAVTAWLTGFLNQLAPSPKRAWLAIKNQRRRPLPRSEDGFRIALCWLKNDRSGADTENVEEAFAGVSGVTLVRSARIVMASGAADDRQPAMRECTNSVLDDWNAELAIIGLVKKPREILSLWFVPRRGEGTLDRGDQPYKLENMTLGDDFHDDLRRQIAFTALTAIAPFWDMEARGQTVLDGLQAITNNISILVDRGTIATGQHWIDLQFAYGSALLILGVRDGGTDRLEKAVQVYRAALTASARADDPLQWAATLNNLGVALTELGRRETGTGRLKEAIEVLHATVEERTRARDPLA